jgi:hypothetical protein
VTLPDRKLSLVSLYAGLLFCSRDAVAVKEGLGVVVGDKAVKGRCRAGLGGSGEAMGGNGKDGVDAEFRSTPGFDARMFLPVPVHAPLNCRTSSFLERDFHSPI